MDILKCIIGILIPFIGTTLGASVVFAFKNKINNKLQNIFLGFASGVMLAASIWSLIIPSIEMSESRGNLGWIPATVGIILGAGFLLLTDLYIQKFDSKITNSLKKSTGKLSFAITLHNIPEGMAVGIVFASALSGNFGMEFMSAMILSIGIAIQNFPEGMAISLPYKSEGVSNLKAFWYGTLSGIVEPIAAIITLLISSLVNSILPYLLSFAAGAMIYVIVSELIPNSQEDKNGLNLATIGVIVGFVIMMILDMIF